LRTDLFKNQVLSAKRRSHKSRQFLTHNDEITMPAVNVTATAHANTTLGVLIPTGLSTTSIVPTSVQFTARELEKQKLFSSLVIACFFSFLFFVIGYVTFTNLKRRRQ